jgi:hypothetical protein
MLEKVRAHIAEYAETEKKMQDPAIYGDPKQIAKLSRRLKQLKPLVDTFAVYEKYERAVADAQAMKEDPELGPIAEEEAVKAREQMPILMEKMKRLLIPKNPDDERSVILEVRAGAGGEEAALNPQHLRQHLGKTQIAAQVPQRYAGPLPGDKMAMIFGGSGDYFAYALSRKGKEVGASIHRIPPFALKAERERDDKTEDATLLATLCRDQPGLFFEVLDPDIALIRLRMAADQRRQAQRDRIACGNRVNRLTVGAIFCREDYLFRLGTGFLELFPRFSFDRSL